MIYRTNTVTSWKRLDNELSKKRHYATDEVGTYSSD